MDLYAFIGTRSSRIFLVHNIYWGRWKIGGFKLTELWSFLLRHASEFRRSEYGFILTVDLHLFFETTVVEKTEHGRLMGIAETEYNAVTDDLKSSWESPCGMGSCLSCQTLPLGFQQISRFARLGIETIWNYFKVPSLVTEITRVTTVYVFFLFI